MRRAVIFTIDRLRELVELDPLTGKLTWLPRVALDFPSGTRIAPEALAKGWNTRWAGKPAFDTLDDHGYMRGRLCGQKFRAHQIVWAISHGRWPEGEIDHINGDCTDNRPDNLREVTSTENNRNRALRRTNKTGISGVHFNKREGRFTAQIRHDGRLKFLGGFQSLEEAAAARKDAEARFGYHENHGRKA